MADEDETLEDVAKSLGEIFQTHELACTRGDLVEDILSVHGTLEQALDMQLQPEERSLRFTSKVAPFLPPNWNVARVAWLNGRRNDFSHAKKKLTTDTIYDTSCGLVDLAVAVWPKLFGSPAPLVRHPPRPVGDRDWQIPSAPAQTLPQAVPPPAPKPVSAPVPARALPAVTVTAPYVPAAARANPPEEPSASLVAPSAAAAARSKPATTPAGFALSPSSRPSLRWVVVVALLVVALAVIGMLPWQTKPRIDPTRIMVGGSARMQVDGGQSAALTTSPGTEHPRVPGYNDGTRMEVIDGPVAYDDMTWWKVRGPNGGEGWLPQEFLVPTGR